MLKIWGSMALVCPGYAYVFRSSLKQRS